MPIDADLIRTLAAQHEGTRLDFKEQQYDWKADGNLELAKDLMAMANALGPLRPEGAGVKGRVEFDADDLTRHILTRTGVRSLPHWYDVEIRVEVEGPTGQRVWHTALTRHPSRVS